jgi:hypothetical protein
VAKETRIAFRASDDLKKRLARAARIVGLSETAMAEACVEALIEYIEANGEIRLPLVVVPEREWEKKSDLARSAGAMPATGRASRLTDEPSEESSRLNDEQPSEEAPQPKMTRALRAMGKKQKE